MIKVNTNHIDEVPLVVEGAESSSILELDEKSYQHPTGDIHYRLTAVLLHDDLLVQGKAELHLETVCGRCLAPISAKLLANDVCHLYEGVAGQTVDITEDVREDLLLLLPLSFLCKKDCQGLCPGCGVNLNIEPCRCSGETELPPAGDSPWGALDNLKLKES